MPDIKQSACQSRCGSVAVAASLVRQVLDFTLRPPLALTAFLVARALNETTYGLAAHAMRGPGLSLRVKYPLHACYGLVLSVDGAIELLQKTPVVVEARRIDTGRTDLTEAVGVLYTEAFEFLELLLVIEQQPLAVGHRFSRFLLPVLGDVENSIESVAAFFHFSPNEVILDLLFG